MLAETTLTDKVIGSAIRVHRQLGPGLLQSAYEACLCFELNQAGTEFQRQTAIPSGGRRRPATFGCSPAR
jgi:GxxExxY protein